MTLEDYLNYELAQGKIDFSMRASAQADGVAIYIHPTGRDGTTTPTLVVRGNQVSLSSGSSAPGWES